MHERTRASIAARAIGALRLAITLIAAGGLASVAVASLARAQETPDARLRYRIAYGAVPVGHLDATFRVDAEGAYAVDASFGTGGLVRLIRQTEGTATARGTLHEGASVPRAFTLAYSYGDRERTRTIGFEGGDATEVEIVPARDGDRRAPTPEQLQEVVDPASALLVPVSDGRAPCDRTLRVFDGRLRLDLALTPSRSKPYRADGWAGEVEVCDIVATPVAGGRASAVREIEAVEGATVALAPLPGREAWIAVELRVPTSVGMVSARAVEIDFPAS